MSEGGTASARVREQLERARAVPDPFASVDAFDEYVGAHAEIGIDEVIFYWPPIELFGQRGPVPAEMQARFERIAGQRVGTS